MRISPRALWASLSGLLAMGLVIAACSDGADPLLPSPRGAPPTLAEMRCTADVAAGTLRCADGEGASRDVLIVGGQNLYVKLTSSNIAVTPVGPDSLDFGFDVTLENLTRQPFGTVDSVAMTPDVAGARVFFHSGPTATGGTGSIYVFDASGFGTFTGAAQPYFQYDSVSRGGTPVRSAVFRGDTTTAKRWTLRMPNTVTTFGFTLFVSSEVPFPGGWTDAVVNADTLRRERADTVTLQPGETRQLVGTARNYVGTPVAGAVLTYASSDGAVATVDGAGLVTAGSAGSAVVTATATDGVTSYPAYRRTVFIVNTVPVVADDSISALENVTTAIPAPGLMSNVTDPENDAAVVAGEVATALGGVARLNADGSFDYLSPAGFAGTDTIHYQVSDGLHTEPGLVIVQVEPSRYWYVRAGAAGTTDGRDRFPFPTVADAQGAAAANDTIFVLYAGATALDGAVALQDGQGLVGQGITADLTTTLNGQPVLILADSAAPTVTRTTAGATITLANDNVLAGIGVTSAAGAAIADDGTGFGTLTTHDIGVNAAGPALSLATGTLAADFALLSSSGSAGKGLSLTGVAGTLTVASGSISNAAGTAFEVVGGTVALTYPGDITNTTGLAVLVSNRATADVVELSGAIADAGGGIEITGLSAAGVVTLSGALTLNGAGIAVHDNTGGAVSFTHGTKTVSSGANPGVTLTNNSGATVSFAGGGLAITTGAGAGFTATGGGTVVVTGANNTVATGAGRAIDLNGVTSNVTFRSAAANGAPNGIRLVNVAGAGVQVTGDGATAGSGGTIQNTTSHAVELGGLGALPVNLSFMDLSGASGISGSDFGVLTAATVSVDAAAGPALTLLTGTLNGTFASLGSAASGTSGVILNGVSGTASAAGGSISGTTGTAFAVIGGSASFTFAGDVTQAANAALLSVTGGHTGTLVFQTGTLAATAGTGLQFSDADGTYQFNGPTTLNGGDAGIDVLTGSNGTLAFGTGTAITNPSGIGLYVFESAPTLTFSGSIGTGAASGRPVVVDGAGACGAVTVAGTLTSTGAGILVQDCTAGTVYFTGTSKSLSTAANPAVTLLNNPGATIGFAGGGLALATTTGAGFSASGGGTLELTGAANTVSTGTGAPLTLDGVAVHANGMNFSGVSATLVATPVSAVSLTNVTGGTIVASGGTITAGVAPAVRVNGGTVSVAWGGSISQANAAALLSVTGHATGTLAFSGPGALSATAGTGLQFDNADGTYTFNGTTSLNGGDAAVDITNGSSGTFTFGTAATITHANAGTAAFLAQNSTPTVTYSGNLAKSSTGWLVDLANLASGSIVFQTGTLNGSGSGGIQASNVDGTLSYNGTTTLNGGDARVVVSGGSSGAITFGSGVAVTNPSTNPAFDVNNAGASANIDFNGSVSTTGARPISIQAVAGGTIDFAGSINASGLGMLVQNNTGGTFTFSHATKKLNTGANAAVTLSSNTGASVVFSGGGLDVDATTGAGFSATGGGTVQVTGANNTIATGTGVALNVQNTTIGASGLTFVSIAHSGGPNGIFLSNTGTTNGLQVTGAGTVGSGGTITNTSGADGATSGNGVYLNGTRNVSLSWMNLSGHANNGLFGTGVRGLTLDKMRFTGNNGSSNSGTFDESAVHLVDAGGPMKFTNSRFDGGAFNGVRVENMSGTNPVLDSLVFENDTVTFMQGSTADVRSTAMLVSLSDGTADTRFRNNYVTFWWGNAIHVLVQGTASGTTRITGNFADNTNGALAGAGGIWVSGGTHAYNISNNTVRHTNGAAISADRVNFGSTMQGTIANNTIGVSGDNNSGSAAGAGIFASHHGPGTTTTRISGNTIRQVTGQAAGVIWMLTGDAVGFGGSGNFNATVVGNDLQQTGSPSISAHMAILATVGTQSGPPTDTDQACLDIGGSTAALRNTITNINTGFGFPATSENRMRVNQRFGTTSRFPGYTGAATGATSGTDLAAYLLGRNTASNSTNANSSTGGFNNTIPAGSACPQPSI